MDALALDKLRNLLAAPEPLDEVKEAVKRAGDWSSWTLDRQVWYVRKRLGKTQAELSRLSGVSQHRISRIEDGEDLKLSTLTALWLPFGYAPLVLPASADVERRPRMRTRDLKARREGGTRPGPSQIAPKT